MKQYDPSTRYIIEDNAEVMGILNHLGVLDQIQPSEGHNTTWFMWELEHHWALLSYHKGHEQERDNGFMAILEPKTTSTKEESIELFNSVIEHGTHGKLTSFNILPRKLENQ